MSRAAINLETRWHSRVQTTDPPRLTPHDIWTLEVRVRAATPLRIASAILNDRVMEWSLQGAADQPTDEQTVDVTIRPYGWQPNEDRVSVGIALQHATIRDRGLLDHPRNHVEVVAPSSAQTGDFLPILRITEQDATLGLIALPSADTEVRRGNRWRLRPDRVPAVDPSLAPLASGHWTGRINLGAF